MTPGYRRIYYHTSMYKLKYVLLHKISIKEGSLSALRVVMPVSLIQSGPLPLTRSASRTRLVINLNSFTISIKKINITLVLIKQTIDS